MILVTDLQSMEHGSPVFAALPAADTSDVPVKETVSSAYPAATHSISSGIQDQGIALHEAAAAGDMFACKALITRGHDPKRRDASGRCAADHARSAGHFELAAALEGRIESADEIVAHAPLDFRELTGLVSNHENTIHRIIAEKRLQARDSKGDTALHIVAMQGKLHLADMLVRAGADVHARNHDGKTPGDVALSNGHDLIAALLHRAAGATAPPPPRVGPAQGAAPTAPSTAPPPTPPKPQAEEAPEPIDDLFDDISFDTEIEAEEFHASAGIHEERARFVRAPQDITLQTDDEAQVDWNLEEGPVSVQGEGIVEATASAGPDESYSTSRHRKLRREVTHSVWHRFAIDAEGCRDVAMRIAERGHATDEDLDDILGLMTGRFDPTDLRINLIRDVEAAGFPVLEAGDPGMLDPLTEVTTEELAEALIATTSRSASLPGTANRVLSMRGTGRLVDAVTAARHTLLFGLAESIPAMDILLYMADRVASGEMDASEMTTLTISTTRLTPENEQFFSAHQILRSLRDDMEAGSGSAVRTAVDLLEDMELAPGFLRVLAETMQDAPELSAVAATISTNLATLDRATRALVLATLPQCRRHAAQRTEEFEDQEDVFQASFLGLLRAAWTYEPETGKHFSMRASIWMLQALNRSRDIENRLIRLPVQREQDFRAIARKREEIERNTLRPARPQELASALELSAERLEQLLSIPVEAVALETLDQLAGQDGDNDPLYRLASEQAVAMVLEEISELEERQRDVLCKRFGIGEDQEMTLEEIGQIYGVTRERIRQIEAKALTFMTHPSRLRMLAKAR